MKVITEATTVPVTAPIMMPLEESEKDQHLLILKSQSTLSKTVHWLWGKEAATPYRLFSYVYFVLLRII